MRKRVLMAAADRSRIAERLLPRTRTLIDTAAARRTAVGRSLAPGTEHCRILHLLVQPSVEDFPVRIRRRCGM